MTSLCTHSVLAFLVWITIQFGKEIRTEASKFYQISISESQVVKVEYKEQLPGCPFPM